MKLLYFTDPHQADHPPASRKDDYREAIFSKLDQIGRLIRKLQINVAICGGDWFHIKAATRNSHYLVRRMIDVVKSWTIPVVTVAGSHDFPWNQVEKLEKQPLGVMMSAEAVQLLDWWTDREWIGPIVGSPPRPLVRIIGFNDDGKASLDEFAKIKKEGEEFLIAVAHHAASVDQDASKFFEAFCYDDLVDFAPDIWCFGHWHIDQGIVSLKSKAGKDKFFVSPGAVSRGAYNNENIDRIPKVVAIELNGGIRFTPVALNAGTIAEVFDVEKLEKLKKKSLELSKFVEELSIVDNRDSSEDLERTINGYKLSEAVRSMTEFYLAEVDSQV